MPPFGDWCAIESAAHTLAPERLTTLGHPVHFAEAVRATGCQWQGPILFSDALHVATGASITTSTCWNRAADRVGGISATLKHACQCPVCTV